MKRGRVLVSILPLCILYLLITACAQQSDTATPDRAENAAPPTQTNASVLPDKEGEAKGEAAMDKMIYDGVYPKHEPYGVGVGAMPGRVVWAHDPSCVEWDGSGYWWELSHFDEAAIRDMVNDSIASLGG